MAEAALSGERSPAHFQPSSNPSSSFVNPATLVGAGIGSGRMGWISVSPTEITKGHTPEKTHSRARIWPLPTNTIQFTVLKFLSWRFFYPNARAFPPEQWAFVIRAGGESHLERSPSEMACMNESKLYIREGVVKKTKQEQNKKIIRKQSLSPRKWKRCLQKSKIIIASKLIH